MTQGGAWVASAAAYKMLIPALSASSAQARICERAHKGLVRARAAHFSLNDQMTSECDVPKEFWWAHGGYALEQDWVAGDFSTFIGEDELRAFGVTFHREDIAKIVPPTAVDATDERTKQAEQLFLELVHLAETVPDLSRYSERETQIWLAQVRASINRSNDPVNALALSGAISSHTTARGHGYASKIMQCLYNAIAHVGQGAPRMNGAFLPAGNPHDALVAVRKVLALATKAVLIVDPYADALLIERYAPFTPDGVRLEILTDSASLKATLRPALEAWIEQYGDARPIEVRVTPKRTLHDRLIILDGVQAFNVGQSFNALADRAPTSVNRIVDADTARLKIDAHLDLWAQASQLG